MAHTDQAHACVGALGCQIESFKKRGKELTGVMAGNQSNVNIFPQFDGGVLCCQWIIQTVCAFKNKAFVFLADFPASGKGPGNRGY